MSTHYGFNEAAIAALVVWLPAGKRLLDTLGPNASSEWNKEAARLAKEHGLNNTRSGAPHSWPEHVREAWHRIEGGQPCQYYAALPIGFPEPQATSQKPSGPRCGHKDCTARAKLCLAHAVAEGKALRARIMDLEDANMSLRAQLADSNTL